MPSLSRAASAILAATVLLAHTASLTDAAENAQLPERKAGLWELKTVMDEGGGPRDHTIRMCIETEMERNTVNANVLEHQENCTKYDIKKADGVTTVDADCKFNGATVTSLTEMRGDFAKGFEVKIKSTTVPPMTTQGQTVPIRRTITQVGTYVGDLCGDLQPGEAAGPDGKKVMVQ